MANFMEELWSSVFTSGTNPTLIVATNVSFAALQLLLITLLIATYSIHFAILSVLCAGLWWSINWFATELKSAQAKEDEAEKSRRRKKEETDWRSTGEVGDSADDEGEDTEVDEGKTGVAEGESGTGPSAVSAVGVPDNSRIRKDLMEAMKDGPEGESAAAVTGLNQPVDDGNVRQRVRVVDEPDRSGEISTDSEWEKVSEQGGDR